MEKPNLGVLADRFELKSRLGGGGFGEVYEAYDRTRGESVALKILKHVSPEALFQFKNEFRSLVEIHERNLVRLFELVAAGDQWFFSMELLRGETWLKHVCDSEEDPDSASTSEVVALKGGSWREGETEPQSYAGDHRSSAPRFCGPLSWRHSAA